MKKVMLTFGTRPEAIKMAPLVKEFQRDTEHFETVVCVTGQHREMLDQVLGIFDITPQYDLNIMKRGQDLYDITARVLLRMRTVLEREKPDIVLVHGDTTTSMAASLAAFYQHIPVGHVEAGLRTHDTQAPWPEELNRQLTARMAQWHFAPTRRSKENLVSENIDEEKIFVTGNTVIDALHMITRHIHINTNDRHDRRMVLITGHRRENFGNGLAHICQAIRILAERYPDVEFVYPMHPNPNVRATVNQYLGHETGLPNVRLIEPLDYFDFVPLMARSTIVLTDSGGIQEEAPGLGKPVLVMRDTTERPEAIEAGTAKLVGTDRDKIVKEVSLLLDDKAEYLKMSHAVNPFGDGKACRRIVSILSDTLQ